MKITAIITGGRDYDDWTKVQCILSLFDIGLIVQGGAKGADRLARAYAKALDIECKTVDADWTKLGRAAGPIRNGEMLKAYQDAVVIAFPGGAGTADCMRQAIKLNHFVLEVK